MNLELYELQKHHKYLQLVLTILNQTNMNFISHVKSLSTVRNGIEFRENSLTFSRIILFVASLCLLFQKNGD